MGVLYSGLRVRAEGSPGSGDEMADRIALAIEPDTDTANQIRRLLEPKGFKVENIPNGDDAMEWGRTHKPAVIVLSVEPRKGGYAISNQLRRKIGRASCRER